MAVDGFIPPAAFMEFQAYNVLVIASDIRQLSHIEYTPAPDIIHEGAGHAPIIANPAYAEYLKRFGKIGSKAISSAKDHEMYHAIRKLSILKEAVNFDSKAVRQAEEKVKNLQESSTEVSEMSQIRNLHWWTVEYGLIGTIEKPKIYGAGLLSSIGESAWCMKPEVQKLPYSIEAATQSFDITKPQPQLYVTPDFAYLSEVLEDFADTMGLRTGGVEGVQKLIDSEALGTVELDSGLQISGIFTKMVQDHNAKIAYIQSTGKSALAYRDQELIGHGTDMHKDGYGTALGNLKGVADSLQSMNPRRLKEFGILEDTQIILDFESGVKVEGTVITGVRNRMGGIMLISFRNCTVTYKEQIFFKPEWGRYDMAIGLQVVSAFGGVADSDQFFAIDESTIEKKSDQIAPPKIEPNAKTKELQLLYQSVRNIREGKNSTYSLEGIFELLQKFHPRDWLLTVEIYELIVNHQNDASSKFEEELQQYLEQKQNELPEVAHLIAGRLVTQNKKRVAS